MSRERIAIYGGSFDPIHFGHLSCVANILNANLADNVIIVPSGDDRYDRSPYVSGEHRFRMIELAIVERFPGDNRVIADPVQIEGHLPESKTVDLVNYLRKQNPDAVFSCIIGSDLLPDLPNWQGIEEVKKNVQFLSLERVGVSTERKSPEGFDVVKVNSSFSVSSNLSSTLMRNLIAEKKSILPFIPASVSEYIENYSLYTE